MNDKSRTRSIPESSASPPVFDALQSLSAFQASNAHVFPSVPSLRWFYRQNREELLAAGAVVELAGRLMINAPIFAEKALAIGQRAASARGAHG